MDKVERRVNEKLHRDIQYLLSIIDSLDEAGCTLSELDPTDLAVIRQIKADKDYQIETSRIDALNRRIADVEA